MKQFNENATVIINRPKLTESERLKQEAKIKAALQQFGKEMVRAEEEGRKGGAA